MIDFCIPEDFPLGTLVSQELTQICIGSNDVRLNFSQIADGLEKWKPGSTIDIEAGFELQKDGKIICSAENEGLGFNSGCLTVLLRRSIMVVERLPKNELSLYFSGGFCLRLVTDPIGFESYHIQINSELVDVAAPPKTP